MDNSDHLPDMPEGGGALRPRPLSPWSVRAMAEQPALQLLTFAAANRRIGSKTMSSRS